MKTSKADNRDRKRRKRKDGMQVDGKSIFILEEQKVKKGKKKNGS